MFYYQKVVGYESSKLCAGTNHLSVGYEYLNFGYESSGYEMSVGTKRPDSVRTIGMTRRFDFARSALNFTDHTRFLFYICLFSNIELASTFTICP